MADNYNMVLLTEEGKLANPLFQNICLYIYMEFGDVCMYLPKPSATSKTTQDHFFKQNKSGLNSKFAFN